MTVREITRIRPGTPAYDELRVAMVSGDQSAAQDFVCVCANIGLLAKRGVSARQRVKAIRHLKDANIEVKLRVG